MLSKVHIVAVVLLAIIFTSPVRAQYDERPADAEKVRWKLTMVVMDGLDAIEQAEVPVKEAVAFIESNSSLKFEVDYVQDFTYHEFTPYSAGPDLDGDGRGDEGAYLMMGWNLPPEMIEALPMSTSYVFIYRMFGNRPLQAGSAVGLEYGLMKGGKHRPYATVPADQWWYVNTPHEGFKSRAAQILTHEIVNTIQAKTEAAPYRCSKLTATAGLPGTKYEAERLGKLDDACYEKLLEGQS